MPKWLSPLWGIGKSGLDWIHNILMRKKNTNPSIRLGDRLWNALVNYLIGCRFAKQIPINLQHPLTPRNRVSCKLIKNLFTAWLTLQSNWLMWRMSEFSANPFRISTQSEIWNSISRRTHHIKFLLAGKCAASQLSIYRMKMVFKSLHIASFSLNGATTSSSTSFIFSIVDEGTEIIIMRQQRTPSTAHMLNESFVSFSFRMAELAELNNKQPRKVI